MSLLSTSQQERGDRQPAPLMGPPEVDKSPAAELDSASSLESSTTSDDPLPLSPIDRICRRLVQRQLASLPGEKVELIEDGARVAPMQTAAHVIRVHDRNFYRRAVLGGGLGVAESYLRGEWTATDLVAVMREFARHLNAFSEMDRGWARLSAPIQRSLHWLKRNTPAGSRRNIAAHYDLSNEFFALMLDPTMTYSSGFFETPAATMHEASLAKYDRICRKLELSPADHVLEIGTGWGGFACFAAENYGCHVTTATISREQYRYARDQVDRAGLSDRVTVLLQDYRELAGQFDLLVSIEMIEAVGERFLGTFFRKCSQLLKPDGMMALQAITIPDHRYDVYRRSVDFIQRYIFPGGFLPSFSAIGQALRRSTDLRLVHSEDFGPHYAETLSRWRRQFWSNIDRIRKLGFDERFVRMWEYYLCYCEAGFHERQIGVSQMLFTKPACRRVDVVSA